MSKKIEAQTTGLSRRARAQGRGRPCRRRGRLRRDHRLSSCVVSGREGAAVPRHRGQPVGRYDQEGQGRDWDHHPEHRRHHRRRDQARDHAAELVRHSGHRVLQPEEARAVRQHPADGRQEDQRIRQHHAGLHQGPIAERQGHRRPGHRAQEGHVRRRPAFDEILADADGMGHPHPDRLQRRHARHQAGPHQAPHQLLGRASEP